MKISPYKVYKFCVYSIVFLNLGFLNIIGTFDRQAMFFSIILGLFSFIVYFFDKDRIPIKRGKDLVLTISLIVGIFIFQLFRIQYEGMTRKAAFTTFGGLLLVLVSFPIYELLQRQFKKVLNFLVKIGFVAIIIRIILWLFYNFLHLNLGRGFFEGRENWTRNILGLSLVRISEPYISGFLFIICIVGLYKNNIFKRRIDNIYGIIILYFYAFFVSQTRMQILVYTIVLVLMLLIQAWNSKKYVLFIIEFLLILIILVANKDLIETFFYSFNPNSITGYSTTLRINSMNYFYNEWVNSNKWLGFGFTPDAHILGISTYWISDFGIYINLFEFGFIGFVILVYPILKGIILSLKFLKKNKIYSNLLIGLTIFILVSLENIYLLNLATLAPIYFGLMLFVENKSIEK